MQKTLLTVKPVDFNTEGGFDLLKVEEIDIVMGMIVSYLKVTNEWSSFTLKDIEIFLKDELNQLEIGYIKKLEELKLLYLEDNEYQVTDSFISKFSTFLDECKMKET